MQDAEIVEKIKKDKDNFALLIKKYQKVVLNFIYSRVWEKNRAEDLTQEVFIKVYKNLDTYDTKKSFKNWILTIARNHTIDWMRSVKFENDNTVSLSEEVKTYDKEYLGGEEVRAYLLKLDKKYREVLLMYYWQEFAYKEIAQLLSLSINTVKTRLRRAKSKFKEILKNEGYN